MANVTKVIGTNHLLEGRPNVSRVANKVGSAVEQNLGVDNVLGEQVDELEELVVRDLVVNVLFDLVKEGDLLGRGESLGRDIRGKRFVLDRAVCLFLLRPSQYDMCCCAPFSRYSPGWQRPFRRGGHASWERAPWFPCASGQ
jgi:hypothetical protein